MKYINATFKATFVLQRVKQHDRAVPNNLFQYGYHGCHGCPFKTAHRQRGSYSSKGTSAALQSPHSPALSSDCYL